MDTHKDVLFRLDSWNIPGLKTVKILRTVSMDEQEDRNVASQVEDPASTENLPEAKATLLRTHKGVVKGQVASEAKSKAVVQVEVHCTPCSTFDDIIKQLEDPRLPTFKLTDLPPATKEDLYRISSPRAPRASLQAPSQAVSLEEEIANFPLIHCPRPDDRLSMLQLDDRARSMPLPPMKFEGGRALFYPDTAPSMPLPDQIGTWPSFVAEQPISSTLSQMTDEEEVTDPSDERPAKRAKLLTTGEKHGTDSSSDSGSTGSAHRGKRLTCLKCGTHQTPQWRIGPQGPRTMCNACGVKYKKELKERERKEKERKAKQQVLSSASKKADNIS